MDARRWRYEVWSEPRQVELKNVRFLVGHRREWLFDQQLLAELRAAGLAGVTVREACRSLPEWPEMMVRSAVLPLMWREYFTVDLTRPLSPTHTLRLQRER